MQASKDTFDAGSPFILGKMDKRMRIYCAIFSQIRAC